jgi:murein DD-endopeptidase MepM/ murein hydrolase activator NlpD
MRFLVPFLTTLLLVLVGAPSSAGQVPMPARQGVWPLSPRPEVVEGFDPPATRWGAGHRGVDLLGHVGEPVHVSLAGTVTFAAPLAGRGVVVVDHGAVRTTYEPVSASVSVGDVLARGAVIGTLERASSHCFPRACLHWGLISGDSYLNPLTLVGAGPIRLLPLTGSLMGSFVGTRFASPLVVSAPPAPRVPARGWPDRAV